jgi:asparagine synthase (glutamine-hydrolysing)
MCGILGLITNNPGLRARAAEALDTLRHRGPDDIGLCVKGPCALGHTRLAILDLSSLGHQPMELSEAGLTIVFNGEIYNHLDLRVELLARGHVFRSTSDTETLLHAYAEWGADLLARLNGIFAFVIHDQPRGLVLVARDHLGVKPLYYTTGPGLFACASELKALTALGLGGALDRTALANYVYFLWSPGEPTPLAEVRKLLPGHSITIDLATLEAQPPHCFYRLPFGRRDVGQRSEADWVDALDEQLTAAVKRQMLSDVPVGFFLSGGLDSSLLVAIARKLRPGAPIKAFTIGGAHDAKEGFSDDLPYARRAAEALGVDLEVVSGGSEVVRDFDRVVWHLDEPQADPAPINVLNICNRARECGYKVLIGGAGGDDLFSGYRRHQALRLEPAFRMMPRVLGAGLAELARHLPVSGSAVRRLRKLLRDAASSREDRLTGYFGWIEPAALSRLFSPAWRDSLANYDPRAMLKQRLTDLPRGTADLDQMLYLEMVSFLVDHNLNYTDKLAMAVGVEVRVPYLDREVVDFACGIPVALKMRGVTTKYVLRRLAERYLPREIIYRPKTGFGAPVREWITGPLHPLVQERLSLEQLRLRGIFDPEAVWDMIERNRRGEIDAAYVIWSLLAIESWMLQFHDPIQKRNVA